jgi:hypothetical protein
MPRLRKPLDTLRKIIGAWPETDERISHGSPTWWGGKKTFASFHDGHHGDGRVAVWVKATFETQDDLVSANPEVFFVPPYVGPSGWVGVRLDRDLDRSVLEDVLLQGYRSVAPKRALAKLEEA